ncbi:cell growth regulator with EF hand domain protein 1 [Erinaceus europaeus]|uniref:Cell growth regulator with EF hand domain protein 1 n=1 Tax=Erinaceus europaeus TaxID=9365 RepID=A0A1S3AC11_ERIEU|nr:cell growth regulator with EF hand domain protein 1 [Erinaceus europaeus]XP_060042699.1 cell growth regulator with EF hand domain protein 1 [Erinaceus europaeus]
MFPWTVRILVLLLPLSQAAPKDGAIRLDPEVPNPFQQRGPEQLRFLQSYLKKLDRMEQEPESLSWEQVLLCMIALYDYDQNGQLDGLELMAMMPVVLAQGAAASHTANPVVLAVDKVLETQDLDGDGLVTPTELISLPGQAPRNTEPRELPEPHGVGGQAPLAEAQEAPNPQEQAGAQVGAGREFLEPLQEAQGQREAGEAPSLAGESWVQAEALNVREEAGPPGGTLDAMPSPQELEVHAIQVENDEM